MAKCCGLSPCNCRVVAGTGTTVTGNGSAANPYTISADGTTGVAVTDSPTVDLKLTGTGAAGDPYTVTADVILDPTPPQGGTNLIHTGPEGLFVECADVRTCFTAGDGITYDSATGEIAAHISRDAGNQTRIGSDGGIHTPATSTSLQAADTPSVDVTVTGTGTAADPYEVTAAVILDPVPPGGGTNLLQEGPDGLFVECADVRTCFTAGTGIDYDQATGVIAAEGTVLQAADTPTLNATVTGTGTAADPYVVSGDVIVAPEDNGVEISPSGLLVAPSADTGNRLDFGTDGRLFVPPNEVGCGLQGDGSAGSPIKAFPIAGDRAWTTDWSCDPVANSTLHCDPNTGALWTPPEHTSAAVTLQQLHPVSTPTFTGPTNFLLVDSNAWSEGTYTADSLSACRGISFSTRFTGHVEVSWTANATFDLGYAIQVNGGALAVRQTHSKLAAGPAGRERWTFGVSQAVVLPPHAGYAVRVYPAIRVTAGSVTIQQWITDTDLIAITR